MPLLWRILGLLVVWLSVATATVYSTADEFEGSREVNTDKRCSRCGEGITKSWSELTDDEREVVKRLPGSADYTLAERQALHRWCTQCWHEEIRNEDRG